MELIFGVLFGIIFATGDLSIIYEDPEFKTNLAKYEVALNRCLDYPKGNIKDCHEVAVFKSYTCVSGCE